MRTLVYFYTLRSCISIRARSCISILYARVFLYAHALAFPCAHDFVLRLVRAHAQAQSEPGGLSLDGIKLHVAELRGPPEHRGGSGSRGGLGVSGGLHDRLAH
eukprot:4371412-Pleurochrysis_carterae.AAC.1